MRAGNLSPEVKLRTSAGSELPLADNESLLGFDWFREFIAWAKQEPGHKINRREGVDSAIND